MQSKTRRKKKKPLRAISNAKGNVYYGMHFYPGIAEYTDEETGRRFRVFLNEKTIREMDKTFPGCPVYVLHKDERISENIDEVREEADGWVIESFYNARDGKHWTKFIVVTDAGEMAVQKGWKLSNCYDPLVFGSGGTWNGMKYNRQVMHGKYEHLAIVPNPRYEESIILTPEQFKRYNEDLDLDLKRLANSKEKRHMAWSIFSRKKVELDKKLKNAVVFLPKSKKEVSLRQLVEDADKSYAKGGRVANSKDRIKIDGEIMTIKDLVEFNDELLEQIKELKKKLKNAKNADYCENEDDEELDEEIDEEEMENEDDEEEDEEEEEEKSKTKNRKKTKNKKKNSMGVRYHRDGDDFEDGLMNSDDWGEEDDDDEEEEEVPEMRRNSKSTKKKKVKNSARRQKDEDEFFDDEEEEEEESVKNSKSPKKKARALRIANDKHRAKNGMDSSMDTIDTEFSQAVRAAELFGSNKKEA